MTHLNSLIIYSPDQADMVNLLAWVLVGIFAIVTLWAAHRLWILSTVAFALWRTDKTNAATAAHGDTVALNGQVFVDQPAPISERLFEPTDGPVGAYVWQVWFVEGGRYTYDFDRGEFRKGREPFASGIETGEFGIQTDGRDVAVNLSWLDRTYDGDNLAGLEVGNPVSNISLPVFLRRYLFDSLYISLNSLVSDCSMDRLRDIIDLYRDDVDTDEFGVGAQGIQAGQQLFVHGELRINGGSPTVVGTDKTPLLVSDGGQDGLKQKLGWQAVKSAIVIPLAVTLIVFFAPI